MSKRKVPATRDDEIFVLKTKMISESTKKTIEIHDFIKKIEDEVNMREILSPKFIMDGDGAEFSIKVRSRKDSSGSGWISVYLYNFSNEDQLLSVTVKGSGVEQSWEVPAGNGCGGSFMSHETYREWAEDHGDVFKLEVVVTLLTKAEGDDWTRTKAELESISCCQKAVASFGKTILEDDATADFTIRCATKEFRVHRNILCARSPVFRASILTPMAEVKKGEIFVEEIGEKTLATIINFIYTGELEMGDMDILELAWAGTKYLLPDFMEILAVRIQSRKGDLSGGMIADLLIAAHRHEAEVLRKIALDKIRGNREIFNDPEFRKALETAPNSILMDVFKDL